MHRAIWLAVLAMIFTCILAYSAGAQGGGDDTGIRNGPVDKGANGQPAVGKVDAAAVAELAKAEEIVGQEGKERDAIAIALPLVATFEKNEDYDHLAECCSLIGEAYYYTGDWPNAEKYMGQAADIGYRFFAGEMSTFPLKVVGEAQFQQQKYDEALSTFQRRVQILRKANDKEDLASALFDVGGVLINLGREEEALGVLNEAETACKARAAELSKSGSGAKPEDRLGNTIDHAEILYHIGIANYHLEKLDLALASIEQAYGLLSKLDPATQTEVQDRLVAMLDDLVMISEKQGKTADAERYRKVRDNLNK
jgi:tetratricopeptide (TPR) repeat protein